MKEETPQVPNEAPQVPEEPKPPIIITLALDQVTGQLGIATSLPPGKEGLRMALGMLRSLEDNIQNQIINMLEENDGD